MRHWMENIIDRLGLSRLFHTRKELPWILSQANPRADLADQLLWLESLTEWVRTRSPFKHEFDDSTGQLQWVRLKFVFYLLERNPEWKEEVEGTLESILSRTSAVELFCHTGLTQEGGLLSEIVDRILKKVLPTPARETRLDDLFPRLFRSDNDALWIENLPPDGVRRLGELLGLDRTGPARESLRTSLLDALTILGEEVAARGVSNDVRSRLPFPSVHHSPFLLLRQRLDEIVAALRKDPKSRVDRCDAELESCIGAIERIYQHLDRKGVSVGLVYTLERQRSSLRRIRMLIDLLSSGARPHRITRFLAELVRQSVGSRNIRVLMHNNLRLLSQKIVERAGASGEHYITRTKAEYRVMLYAGLGGGAITVVTTLLKFGITAAHFPPFFDGLFCSLNYAGSFILMQFVGFTLATKQPAMTGPALAGKLKHLRGPKDIREFVDEVCRLTRSQFAAVLGNLAASIPIPFVLDQVWRWSTGKSILGPGKAGTVIQSLDPFGSLTLFFAAWTGVILWSAGIAAGWVENWVVYRRLPEAIAQHRMLNLAIGKPRSARLSKWFLEHVGGVSSCITLGFLLGFTPVIGGFFGFPLDVRHVTLHSAALSFAASASVGPTFPILDVCFAVLGILVTLALNFGVSFALAFNVATRARDVQRRSVFVLARRTGAEFRRNPMAFFFLR